MFMRRILLSIPPLLVSAVLLAYGVQRPYETGKILDIQEKTKSRELYSIVNTPVTQDDPYYEVMVQVKDMIYVGEYTPRHSADILPQAWKPGSDVKARIEKHYMYLKRPDGGELQFAISTRHRVENAVNMPEHATAK